MTHQSKETEFAICVKNEGYSASLEVRKVYQVIPDTQAAQHQMVRVVDESGEDYLYPADFFVLLDLPKDATKVFSLVAN